MRRRTSIGAACFAALLTGVWPADSASAQTGSEDPTRQAEELLSPRIVNGLFTGEYPSTALLLSGSYAGWAEASCSGTLIGCETVLTAAHCVDGSTTASDVHVFFQNAGIFGVSTITLHPSYTGGVVADLAVLRLSTPVTGITPSPINESGHPAFGSAGTLVGFGRSGGNATTNRDYGLKRMGEVVTASCAGHPVSGVANNEHLCWTYAAPIGDPGEDSNTCNGDSGGPLFTRGNDRDKVVGTGQLVSGVTRGGTNGACLATDWSFDVDVFQYRQWIAQQAGTDLDASFCGDLAQVGELLWNSWYTPLSGSLGAKDDQARFTVHALPSDRELRVTLNGEDDGDANIDFDLYVKYGAPPTLDSYDCRDYGSNSFGVCEFALPQQGTWHILVNSYRGEGSFQVTATGLGEVGTSQARRTQTANPTHAGYRVDWCKTWAAGCGAPAAEAFCDAHHGAKWSASAWKQAANVGATAPTRTLGDGLVCDQAFCDGFESITCDPPRGGCGNGAAVALVIPPAVVSHRRLRRRRSRPA